MWSLSGLCVCLGVVGTLAIPRQVLYPFGTEHGDERLAVGDDLSSSEVYLEVPIAFYDDMYRSLYVNLNGHLSFDTELPIYRADLVLPFGFKMIAPFLADIDIQLSGNVYYRETRDPSLLEMAARELHPDFAKYRNFQPRALFIATWDNVGSYEKQYDLINTFQIIVASDGVDSFVMFLYPEINWVKGQGKGAPAYPDIPAQAGFDAGDRRRSYVLPGSGNENVIDLALESNAGAPGVWRFRVGNLNGGEIETTDSDATQERPEDERPDTCAAGGDSQCSINGMCRDYSGGFCCECQPAFVGNGVNCVEPDMQMRMNGKVTGNVNGVNLEDSDLHAFLMFSDARVHVAISPVTPQIGFSLQGLYIFGGGLGWLLALPGTTNAINGYTMTGGDFKRTVTIEFKDFGLLATMRQTSMGHNAVGHMEMNTEISGSIPPINSGSQVEVPDYEVEYRRTRPGMITSYLENTFLVDGNPIHFTVDETIEYTECPHKPYDADAVQRISVTRNFVHFDDDAQKIVRYAQLSRLVSTSAQDPCAAAGYPCDDNAECVPYGDSHQCLCKTGYRLDFTQTCVDMDECAENQDACDRNADCYNSVGSYQCRCRQGYTGNGQSCERDMTCADLFCDRNAICVYDPDTRKPMCHCNPGFHGDGNRCEMIAFDCNEVNNCDQNAECVYDRQTGRYACDCNDGFSGDGVSCSDTGEAEPGCENCDRNAECAYDVYLLSFTCQCFPGFSGNGQTCFRIEEPGFACDTMNCDRNAACVFDVYQQRDVCECNAGFAGDGYVCQPSRDCSVYNYCDRNARCLPGPVGGYECVCNEGYEGDGQRCVEASCNVINNCDINADCLFDPHSSTYQCRCGQGYQGDGYSCRLTADCRRDPGICDPNARCEVRGYDYICVCNPGYRGDGYRCAPLGDKQSYLMVAQGMTIIQMPFTPTDDNPGRPVLSIPGQTAIGIDVDCFARYFYWTDISAKIISKAQLDGKDIQILVKNLGSPEGVSIDWITGNMYWTDSKLDTIEVAKTDGTSRKLLISGDLVDPRGIVVDPISGVMFWTDWNRQKPRIERAHLDGAVRTVLVNTEVGLPNGLTIDYETHHLCWIDAETKRIECVNYEGQGRRTIYTHTDYPFDITYTHNVFYWTDWHKKYLPSINKFASEANEGLELPAGGHGRMYGIAVVKSQCPAGTNACALNNGGCRFICFPTPNGGRTCACPDDIDPDECNRVGLYI